MGEVDPVPSAVTSVLVDMRPVTFHHVFLPFSFEKWR